MIPKVYILDDDLTYARLLSANLGEAGRYHREVFESPRELLARQAEAPPDAVITDLVMPDVDGIEVTRQLRRSDEHLPIFVLTAHGDIDSAVEALKAGATDFLTKPVNVEELTVQLERALEERPLREEASELKKERQEEFSVGAILGRDPRIEEVREFVRKVADIPNPTILLLGESGTGKNLVARSIHYSSPHTDGRFVEINCSALPPKLLESELFGYQKGAFTDAKESKRGLVEVADGGTLFLDEIGDLSPALQAKLLNFLESRRFRRVGGTEEIEVTQRVISATNTELEERVRSGDFRADLYYRISVATHTMPPLREIKGDIPALAENFRQVFNREFKKDVKEISPEAMEALQDYEWPGNVRELRNVIERAMIFAEGEVLEPADIPPLEAVGVTPRARAGAPSEAGDGFHIPKGLTLKKVEKEYIRRTLEECDGSIQRSAEMLGISRKNLWEKRKKYDMID